MFTGTSLLFLDFINIFSLNSLSGVFGPKSEIVPFTLSLAKSEPNHPIFQSTIFVNFPYWSLTYTCNVNEGFNVVIYHFAKHGVLCRYVP